jgi:hypothetical protein
VSPPIYGALTVGYLDEFARRLIAAILLIALVVVTVLAVADAPPFFEDPPTAAERAQDSVESFFAAGREGDFERACELLTPQASAYVRVIGAQLGGQRKVRNCPAVLESQSGRTFRGTEVEIIRMRVSGYRAVAETELRSPGKRPEERAVSLELQEGDWLIADFAG